MMNSRTVVALLLTLAATSEAFVAPASRQSSVAATTTELHFGIPTFGAKQYDGDDKKKKADDVSEKKIDLSGLVQLITAGVGSPFLGNFEGIEEETGKMMFSLEANNLVDEVCSKNCSFVSSASFSPTLTYRFFFINYHRTGNQNRRKCHTLRAVGLILKTSRRKTPKVASSFLGTNKRCVQI
jgi:hypothetical protein